MEHDSEPGSEQPKGWGSLIIKLIVGAIVIFLVAVALVFGACLLG